MALIPADVGLQMRLQNELLPLPTKPVQGIPADLPELKSGQGSPRIQEVCRKTLFAPWLPAGPSRFRCPNRPRAAIRWNWWWSTAPQDHHARSPPSGVAPQTGAAATPATFSRAAQLLSSLLLPREKPGSPLNRSQPCWSRRAQPRSGARLEQGNRAKRLVYRRIKPVGSANCRWRICCMSRKGDFPRPRHRSPPKPTN